MLIHTYKKKLKKFLYKRLSKLYDKPLPPATPDDVALVEELRTAFHRLVVRHGRAGPASEQEWLDNVDRLRNLIFDDDPRRFLRWPVVSGTMFAKDGSYIDPELKYLRSRMDWHVRWCKAIEESLTGHPVPYWRYPRSSGNLIHHAYHLARFEQKTDIRVDRIRFIFEFGGGYGSMCRLLHNLGFEGTYVIFDLAGFSALQRFFLKSVGISVWPTDSLTEVRRGAVCISDLEQLGEILAHHTDSVSSMFIATWSISEAPVGLRDCILPLVSDFDTFLIAYQHRFQEIDNHEFFDKWKATRADIEWHDWEIEHMPGNQYLIGKRSN